jgi:hypothetical protein
MDIENQNRREQKQNNQQNQNRKEQKQNCPEQQKQDRK